MNGFLITQLPQKYAIIHIIEDGGDRDSAGRKLLTLYPNENSLPQHRSYPSGLCLPGTANELRSRLRPFTGGGQPVPPGDILKPPRNTPNSRTRHLPRRGNAPGTAHTAA